MASAVVSVLAVTLVAGAASAGLSPTCANCDSEDNDGDNTTADAKGDGYYKNMTTDNIYWYGSDSGELTDIADILAPTTGYWDVTICDTGEVDPYFGECIHDFCTVMRVAVTGYHQTWTTVEWQDDGWDEDLTSSHTMGVFEGNAVVTGVNAWFWVDTLPTHDGWADADLFIDGDVWDSDGGRY